MILLLVFSAAIAAQEFEIRTESDEVTGELGQELIYYIEVENVSQEEIVISFVRAKNDIPEQWTSSLCFDFCFAPFIDSIATSADFQSSPVQPGEIRELSVHIFPLELDGEGEIEMVIENVNDQQYSETVVFKVSTGVTSAKDEHIPGKFGLEQNYPNPFNPSTVIKFSLPESERVTLKVFNILGNEIAVLINSIMNAGSFEYKYDASSLASGIYFYELRTSKFRSVRKMILEK
jgi:hypothetical protein